MFYTTFQLDEVPSPRSFTKLINYTYSTSYTYTYDSLTKDTPPFSWERKTGTFERGASFTVSASGNYDGGASGATYKTTKSDHYSSTTEDFSSSSKWNLSGYTFSDGGTLSFGPEDRLTGAEIYTQNYPDAYVKITCTTKQTIFYTNIDENSSTYTKSYTSSQLSTTDTQRDIPYAAASFKYKNSHWGPLERIYGAAIMYSGSWKGGRLWVSNGRTGRFSDCFNSVAGASTKFQSVTVKERQLVSPVVTTRPWPDYKTKRYLRQYSPGNVTSDERVYATQVFYRYDWGRSSYYPITGSTYIGMSYHEVGYYDKITTRVEWYPDVSYYTKPYFINGTTVVFRSSYAFSKKNTISVAAGFFVSDGTGGATYIEPDYEYKHVVPILRRHDDFICTFKTVAAGYLGFAGSFDTGETSSIRAYKKLTTNTRGNNFGGPHFALSNHNLTALIREGGTVIVPQITQSNNTYFVEATAPKDTIKKAEFTAIFSTTSTVTANSTTSTQKTFYDSGVTKSRARDEFYFKTGYTSSVYSYTGFEATTSTVRDYTETTVKYEVSVADAVDKQTIFTTAKTVEESEDPYYHAKITLGTAGDFAGFGNSLMEANGVAIDYTIVDKEGDTVSGKTNFTPKNRPNLLTIPAGHVMYFQAHRLYTTTDSPTPAWFTSDMNVVAEADFNTYF